MVPAIRFLAIEGANDPNEEGCEPMTAIDACLGTLDLFNITAVPNFQKRLYEITL